MYLRIFFLFFSFLLFFRSYSQDTLADFSFNDKFNDANLLMEEKLYPIALPVWLEILQMDTSNSNWNYKVGICYLNSGNERTKSLTYLEKAILKTAKNYNPFSPSEDKAPIDAFYYLAKSYQINNQIDKAIEYFNKFKETAPKKHYLIADVDRSIEMCGNAKEMLNKPVTIKITNIGDKISSAAPEYGAVISLDERALYFTSRRLWKDSVNLNMKERSDGEYFEDIYVSYKDKDGKWQEPELLNFNRPDDHEATITLSADGQTLYIYRDENGNGNLYQSFFFDTTWSAPVPMGSDINSKSHETHLSVSLDGKTLYFVSNRKGGLGEKDIYKCTKLPNGQWSLAQNIGPQINTPYDEDGPFIHPDGKTLFFSSKGHKSIGGFDIFMSTLKDDGTWTSPENLGYPINTTDDDIFFVLSPDGKRAYYSSFRTGGLGSKDIYIIEQPDAMEHSLTLIKGTISVPEGMDMPEDITIIITDNETGEFITEARPLKRNGSFVFIIPPGKNYNISYVANGVEFYNENVYVPIGTEYKEVDKELRLDPSKLGTSDAVSVNIISSTDKPKPQWKIRFLEAGNQIPDSSIIQYLNESGNIIYEERLSKSGFFAYHELENSKPYLFTIKSKDNPLCFKGEIVLLGKEDSSYRFLPDSNCIFREFKEQKPRFLFSSLDKELPQDISVQYLDESGSVLFEEKMDAKGYFAFRELPGDNSYIVKIKSNDTTLCGKGEIVVPGAGGITFTLAPDENCVYRVKEKKSTFVFDALNKTVPPGLTVQYISDDGKIIDESKLNAKGEFKYRELSPEKPYAVILKTNDKTLCDQGEVIVPGPGGIIYTLVADENCVFRVKEKKSKFIYENLAQTKAAGFTLQVMDDRGKLLSEHRMNELGEIDYSKLPAKQAYSIIVKSDDPEMKYAPSEIIVPSVGKAYYKFTPDSAGIFRKEEPRPEKAELVLEDTVRSIPDNITVQYIDKSGKLIAEDKIDTSGEFKYREIPMDNPYTIQLKVNDKPLCDKAEINIPGPGGAMYAMVADENCIYRIKDKTTKFAYQELEKAKTQGLTVQVLDDKGKLLSEHKMNELGEFNYSKLPSKQAYSIKVKSDDPEMKFSNSEIIVPSVGKSYYVFTPDTVGIFRMTEYVTPKSIAQKEKEKQKEKEIVKEKEPPVQPGVVILEKTANFDYNRADISVQYKKELDEAAKVLKENPSYKIEISGHTDSKGTDEYNNALSKRRSENAARYLSSKGISQKRITTKGFGKNQPIAPNVHPDGTDDPEGRQKNRRIEIKVMT